MKVICKLLFLYNAFCKALDAGKEVRVIFCDISKAFCYVYTMSPAATAVTISATVDETGWP